MGFWPGTGARPKIPLDDPVGRKVTGTSSIRPPRRLRVLTAGDSASPSFPLRCQLHQYSFLPESPRGSPYSLAVCPLRFQAATCVAHSCRFMVGDSSSPTHATRAHPPSRDALHQAVTRHQPTRWPSKSGSRKPLEPPSRNHAFVEAKQPYGFAE